MQDLCRSVDVSCDCLHPDDIGPSIAQFLVEQGFCSIDLGLASGLIEASVVEAQGFEEHGSMQRPFAELEEGLLGAFGSYRIAELGLPGSAGSEELGPADALRQLDGTFSQLGKLLTDPLSKHFAWSLSSRTAGLLHEVCSLGTNASAQPMVDENSCSKWFSVLSQHKLMCVHCLGPAAGILELAPLAGDGDPLHISMQPGALVVLRADSLSHNFVSTSSSEPSYCLTCFFQQGTLQQSACAAETQKLTPCAELLYDWAVHHMVSAKEEEDGIREDTGEVTRPLSSTWRRVMNHCVYKGYNRLGIRSMACRLPGAWGADMWCCALSIGPDFNVDVPYSRWKHEDWFEPSPESWQQGKTFCRHAAFMEGADLFNAQFFGLAAAEAELMDPRQRQVLEVGYEAMRRAGYSKSSLLRCAGGIYIGAVNQNEWGSIQSKLNSFSATGRAASILAGRVSFALGLKGPSVALDAGGAAGLCAVNLGADGNRVRLDGSPATDFSCCLGASVLLSPASCIELQASGLLSSSGRCRTFDASASGCTLGEGTAAVLLKRLVELVDDRVVDREAEPLDGVLAGTSLNHGGSDAGLRAPSLAAETEVLQEAVRSAGIGSCDVDLVECDGRSCIVGDAVELLVVSQHRGDDPQGGAPPPAVLGGSVKSNMGAADGAAGLVGILKVLLWARRGAQSPHLHLRQQNPLVEDAAAEWVSIATELTALQWQAAYAGVTAFGLGTNAHVIVLGQAGLDARGMQGQLASVPTLGFWPGGARGRVEESRHSYYIKGSWTRGHDEAALMEDEGFGIFSLSFVLGDAGRETFQLWLDGDPARALHPPEPLSVRGIPVCGPDDDRGERCWLVGGALADHSGRRGRTGDRCRVQLEVSGRWRKVGWTFVESDGLFDVLQLVAAVVGSSPYSSLSRRSYDIVLYGATGFTGRLCAQYLAGIVQSSVEPWVRSLRVAIAGRSMPKLEKLQQEIGFRFPMLTADSDDMDALLSLARSTCVCISAAGPFMRFSRNLVAACSEVGTDYTDINGEAPFVRYLIDHFHVAAEASGSFIVPNCGFDCVPSDLGCLAALELLHKRSGREHGCSAVTVRNYMDVRGVVSGGTIASGIMVAEDPELEAQVANPFVLGGALGANPAVGHEDVKAAHFDDRRLCWTAPLEMARVNARVVRRSQHLFQEHFEEGSANVYSTSFSYRELAVAPTEAAARRMAAPPPSPEERRRMVEAGQLPAPGSGPDASVRARSSFEARHVAEYDDDPDGTRVCVAVSGGDPGYTETSKMAVEAAIALALRHHGMYSAGVLGRGRVGGVLTSAFALGHIYTRRLHMAGLVFRRVDPPI